MVGPRLGQQGELLAQMVAEMAPTWREQVVLSRRQAEQLRDRSERHAMCESGSSGWISG